MGVISLPKTVTRQRRACDFWTQALLRMSPAWVRFLVYNTGWVQYRWTGLDLLTADRLKMQDWKIVNSSKYSLSCCTYVFHRCRLYLRFPYLHFPPLHIRTYVFRTCKFHPPVLSFSVLAFSVAPYFTQRFSVINWPTVVGQAVWTTVDKPRRTFFVSPDFGTKLWTEVPLFFEPICQNSSNHLPVLIELWFLTDTGRQLYIEWQ